MSFGDDILAAAQALNVAFGSTFQLTRNGVNLGSWTAVSAPIGDRSLPELYLQGPENVRNLNPHMLDLIDPACPIDEGDYVIQPVGADPTKRRFRVVNTTPVDPSGVLTHISAVLVIDPVKQP